MCQRRVWGPFGRAQLATVGGEALGEAALPAQGFLLGSLRAFTRRGDGGGTSGGRLCDFWAGVRDPLESKFWATAGSAASAGNLQAIDDSGFGNRWNHTRKRRGLPGSGRRGDCGDSLIPRRGESGRSCEGIAESFVGLTGNVSEPGNSSGHQPAEQADLSGVVDVVKSDSVQTREKFFRPLSFKDALNSRFQRSMFA